MADPQRISTPLSSSPGRTSSQLSRPNWPWSSPSLLRQSHRSSQSSLSSATLAQSSQWDSRSSTSAIASPAPSTGGNALWQPGRIQQRHHTGSTSMGYAASMQEENTRQWHSTGIEWVVRDVQRLCNYIEAASDEQAPVETGDGEPPSGNEEFEILDQSPILGENKFKLEISRTPPSPEVIDALQTLSLYITLLMDFHPSEYEVPVTIMTAIKCQDDRVGERGARPDWVWEHWQHDFVFRPESEVWACSLPPLSEILQRSRIRETDSLVICVQIHSPTGPVFYSQPSAYYVPRDLLDGLEASLDNANTGDVKFVCLERMAPDSTTSPIAATSDLSSQADSSQFPFSDHTTARKRVIYAHSDILSRRSDYFATMLVSSFSENTGIVTGERTAYTINVEEADFDTIYWLLKFCYANWLLFKEDDDPRAAVDTLGSAKLLDNVEGGEWDWKTFRKSGGHDDSGTLDARSVASRESLPSERSKSPASIQHSVKIPTSQRAAPATPVRTAPGQVASASRQASAVRRPSQQQQQHPLPPAGLSSSHPKTIPGAVAVQTNFSASNRYPLSPRQHRSQPTPDPHAHPTAAPRPASALMIYQVAQRYGLPGLSTLALEHMMSTLTPQSCFALLLATATWDELKILVEDYVVDKWEEVSISSEFEQCCQEIAAGEWGPQGGSTLMALFRRLRSPATPVPFARP